MKQYRKLIKEKDVLKGVRAVLQWARCWFFKMHPSPFQKWTDEFGTVHSSGMADIIGIYPVKVDDLVKAGVETVGVFMAIENKRPGKEPTELQHSFLSVVRKHHGIGLWTDNDEKLQEALGLFQKGQTLGFPAQGGHLKELFRKEE
jgi:hypothetical protein